MKNSILIAGVAISLLASCEKKVSEKSENAEPSKIELTEAAPTSAAEENAPQATSETALATKSLNGYTVTVMKAKVVGNLLSVELKIDNPDKSVLNPNISLNNVYYIDDSTNKQVKLLKDDNGTYLANPISKSGEKLYIMGTDANYLLNFKFSVPSPETKTISLNIPEMGSFDEIPVSR